MIYRGTESDEKGHSVVSNDNLLIGLPLKPVAGALRGRCVHVFVGNDCGVCDGVLDCDL